MLGFHAFTIHLHSMIITAMYIYRYCDSHTKYSNTIRYSL